MEGLLIFTLIILIVLVYFMYKLIQNMTTTEEHIKVIENDLELFKITVNGQLFKIIGDK